jgi:putative ABC transport system permease protein
MKKSLRMLIPAGIAIVIGTAFIASTFLFGNAMNNSLSSQLLASFGQANYTVAANSNASSEDQRSRAAADFHLDAMRAIDGVDWRASRCASEYRGQQGRQAYFGLSPSGERTMQNCFR